MTSFEHVLELIKSEMGLIDDDKVNIDVCYHHSLWDTSQWVITLIYPTHTKELSNSAVKIVSIVSISYENVSWKVFY